MVGGSGRIKGYTSGGADSDVLSGGVGVGRCRFGNQKSRRFENQLIWMFPKIGVPPKSSILIGVFHYKPSILGYPYFWKHPYDKSPTFFFAGLPILGAGFLNHQKYSKVEGFLQQKHLKDLGSKSVYIMDIPMMDIP